MRAHTHKGITSERQAPSTLQLFMQLVHFTACHRVASYINLPSHSINQLDTNQWESAPRNMFMKRNNFLLPRSSQEYAEHFVPGTPQ